ncbi:Hypothetical protein SRAE_0000050600 [Strongyloides ratti]|uniref:Uncharacterized protein n=1 Tax=Strongyloides ratti TaxID=34506 RepID=A0A090KV31_STRRB|nr:Hypothetical protein SRAE_0000050600 [Strongyloides ratti]CEF61380.1 Hypothetical protein SRAE_0000050600 [Strongyloides ratti]
MSKKGENFKIICDIYRDKLRNKLYSISYQQGNKDLNFYYRISIKTITGDIPALRKINNLTGCNGSYGCTYCFHKGGYIKTGEGAGQGKMVFNNGTKMELKTMIEYERYATLLENIPREIMFGMLGKSHIDGIIQIPIDIAIDYMHTVLLEPIKEDMTSIRDGDKKMYSNGFKLPKMTENMIDFFDHSLKLFILPREYKKNMKSLKEFGNFKAIEWKFFMLYGFPTIFLESMKNRINEFVVLQLSIISGIGLLMMDDINENELKMSENLLSLWFDEKVRIIGVNGMKLKSHLITHLHAIVKKFGNLTKYSCFAGEGLIQMLGRMISQKTETNSLNQIKKKFQDFHMASFIIEKEEKFLKNKFIQIPIFFYNIFKNLFPEIGQYRFTDKLYFKGFTIRASIDGMIDRDNFLIVKIEENNEIIYKPILLLAVFINKEKEVICFGKELVIVERLLFKNMFSSSNLNTHALNLLNVVDDSTFFQKYFIINNCYEDLNWVKNSNNIIVFKKNSIYSKGLIIKSKSRKNYVCPMLHSFEHN